MRYIVASGKTRRRGIVAPLMALCLVVILVFTALAVDGGLLLKDRRNLQAAADASALAAAIDLYNNFSINSGLDPGGTAKTSALDTASDNGFTNGTNNVVVTVNIPPLSGNYVGQAAYVEVIITTQQQPFFSAVIGEGNMPVGARAVAVGGAGEGSAIIVLDPKGSNTLQASHSGSVDVTGGNIVVDSTDQNGMHLSSTGNIQADNVLVNGPLQATNPGGYSSSSGAVILNSSKKVASGYHADPLASLAAPSVPATDYGNVNFNGWKSGASGAQINNGNTFGTIKGNTITLNPGYYSGGLTINDGDPTHTYVLSSGVYYFGGNVSFSNFPGTMTDNGVGVCLYLTGGGFTLSTSGTPTISLSAITSGTYAGYPVLFQSSGSPYGTGADTHDFTLSGGGTINIDGIIYLPFANNVTLSHSGTINLTGQMITNTLNLSNTGNMNVTYQGPPGYAPGVLYLVE